MLDLPENSAEIEAKAKTDVRREMPNVNPFLKNSLISAFIVSFSNRVYDFYLQLREAIRQNFPDTATGQYLEQWGSIWGINRLAATQSSGNIVVTGDAGSAIPDATTFSTSDSLVFISQAASIITTNTLSIDTLTEDGNVATATVNAGHNLSSLVTATIAGSSVAGYNVSNAQVSVISPTQFTYKVNGPLADSGGNPTVTSTSALVPVRSEEFQNSSGGIDLNLDPDTPMTIQTQLTGVDNIAAVDGNAIGGGSDIETDAALRVRLINRLQNPVANFNVAAIDAKAREVNGVTRVWIQEATPAPGQVTTYFVRDEDADIVPSGSELADVKASILEIKPANTIDDDVIVVAPTKLSVNVTITSLTPGDTTMIAAVQANLEQFFREEVSPGVNIQKSRLQSVVHETIDPDTGNGVQSFTMSAPASDVTVASNEIPVLGTTNIS